MIAHAERYAKSYRGIEDIHWLKEHGCRIQVNIYSIKEDISEKRRILVQEMLSENLVDFRRKPEADTEVREDYGASARISGDAG